MTAIQVTAGQPARLPELLSVQHANSSTSARRLYVYGEQLVIVILYNKTLSATGAMGKMIARLLPVQVSQMLLEYLVLVRPVQIRLARTVYEAPDLPALHTVLFMVNGKRWSGDAARHRFQTCTRTGQLAQGIGVADWRLISIAFLSKHSRVDEEEEADEVTDLQAGHSTRTALTLYGISMSDTRSMGAEQLEAYASASCLWHEFLGITSRGVKRGAEAVPTVLDVSTVPMLPMAVSTVPVVHQVYHNAWEKLPPPNAGTLECLRAVYGPTAYPRSRKQAFALD